MPNFHVVLVHFPIALLTLYALAEILHLERLRRLSYWFYIKAVFVMAGAAGAAAAILSGLQIENIFVSISAVAIAQLVRTHKLFGITTAIFFGLLALAYLLVWIGRSRAVPGGKLLNSVERFLGSWWMPVLGLIGLGIISVTGALGGAIAFGPNVDPMTRFIYDLFNFQ